MSPYNFIIIRLYYLIYFHRARVRKRNPIICRSCAYITAVVTLRLKLLYTQNRKLENTENPVLASACSASKTCMHVCLRRPCVCGAGVASMDKWWGVRLVRSSLCFSGYLHSVIVAGNEIWFSHHCTRDIKMFSKNINFRAYRCNITAVFLNAFYRAINPRKK